MKRYDLFYQNGHDGEMEENEGGDYVLYTDAEELQRQLAEVTRERDAARAMLVVADARINYLMGNPK